ncbi:unnamed protein product [Lupinus luteus]|uniref:HTH myb-type domain-containing protein n=1 Tax=Lupinus luteus TaxID=3873 RepID=A0AAV1YIG8_LUPLU
MMKNTNDHDKNSKKERVAWSEELHRKFVFAVSQLGGIDKAAPKKILALMKGEKLTKENVASHLQKYRLHLKRVSSTFEPNPKGPTQFYDTNDAAVQNGYQSAVSQEIPTSQRYSNQGPDSLFNDTLFQWSDDNGKLDFNFCERDHGNGITEPSEEDSSLMEQHQEYFGNQQLQSQGTCMATTNIGLVQDLVTTSSSCCTQELHGIAELRHGMAAIRHENRQLRAIVQAMKAQQDMLVQALLQRTIAKPYTLTKQ